MKKGQIYAVKDLDTKTHHQKMPDGNTKKIPIQHKYVPLSEIETPWEDLKKNLDLNKSMSYLRDFKR